MVRQIELMVFSLRCVLYAEAGSIADGRKCADIINAVRIVFIIENTS